jgi:hypothetical protein
MNSIIYGLAVCALIVAAFVAAPFMLPFLAAVAAWQYWQRNGARFRLSSLLIIVTIASLIFGAISVVYHRLPQ